MMIVAGDPPDFRTISEFRKRHLGALAGLFVHVLKLAAQAGLVKLGHVALDGTKLKANASKQKAMSYERMKKREAEHRHRRNRNRTARRSATSPIRRAASRRPRMVTFRATTHRPQSTRRRRSSWRTRSTTTAATRRSSLPCSTPSRPTIWAAIPDEVSADAGYCSAANLRTLSRRRIPEPAANQRLHCDRTTEARNHVRHRQAAGPTRLAPRPDDRQAQAWRLSQPLPVAQAGGRAGVRADAVPASASSSLLKN